MPDRPSPTRLLLTVAAMAYIFGAGGYFAYGYATSTGLSGWLSTRQMQFFGSASERITFVGTLLVWLLGTVVFFVLIARLNKAEQYVPAAPQALSASQWSLKSRVVSAVVVLAVAGGIFGYLSRQQARTAAEPLRRLSLDGGGTLPPDTELAAISGVAAANYTFVLEEKGSSGTRTRTAYAPLVAESWQPSQPVRYVVKSLGGAYVDSATHRVFLLDSARAFQATYDGQLSANSLPTFVAEHYAASHLTLAAPYYVLDDNAVYSGRALDTGSTTRWLVLGAGLLLAVLVLSSKQPKG